MKRNFSPNDFILSLKLKIDLTFEKLDRDENKLFQYIRVLFKYFSFYYGFRNYVLFNKVQKIQYF